MIALYHNRMSSASQKVRLCLEEKSLPWESREIDLREGEQYSPNYLKLNARGIVPTLLDDGDAISESTVINEYLEGKYSKPSLLPTSAIDQARVRRWTKQIDDAVHDVCVGVLTFGIVFRPQLIELGDRGFTQVNKTVDPVKRQRRLDLLLYGLESSHFRLALICMKNVLGEMESALAETRWLAAKSFTLADLSFVPYVLRFRELGFHEILTPYQKVLTWFSRCEARKSFETAITAWRDDNAIEFMMAKGLGEMDRVKEMWEGLV